MRKLVYMWIPTRREGRIKWRTPVKVAGLRYGVLKNIHLRDVIEIHTQALPLPPWPCFPGCKSLRWEPLTVGMCFCPQHCHRVREAFLRRPWVGQTTVTVTGRGAQDSEPSMWNGPDTLMSDYMNFQEESILPFTTTDHSPEQGSQGNNNDKASNDNI